VYIDIGYIVDFVERRKKNCSLSSLLISNHCKMRYLCLISNFRRYTYSPMKVEQTQCSEMLAFKLQTPVNHPEESTRSNYWQMKSVGGGFGFLRQ
jgi:hypothetical protein